MFDPRLFATVFGVIFVAELPDKTALAALVLATRHKPLPVFLGTALALTVQSVVAIVAGGLLARLPARPVHVGAGALFLVSALFMWRRGEETPEDSTSPHARELSFLRAFGQTFLVVFVAEWGDLTQLGTAALAARYGRPLTVFFGATLALSAVAALAVFVGNRAGKLLDPAVTKRVAAVLFAVLGVALMGGVI